MDELLLRAGLIGVALLIAAVAVMLVRRRSRGSGQVVRTSLASGVYLFTSSTCADCDPARATLVTKLGESGFVELTWEDAPRAFEELAIDEVPTTVVVGDGGATLFPGQPDRALSRLGR